jgi:hypothetical protein
VLFRSLLLDRCSSVGVTVAVGVGVAEGVGVGVANGAGPEACSGAVKVTAAITTTVTRTVEIAAITSIANIFWFMLSHRLVYDVSGCYGKVAMWRR